MPARPALRKCVKVRVEMKYWTEIHVEQHVWKYFEI